MQASDPAPENPYAAPETPSVSAEPASVESRPLPIIVTVCLVMLIVTFEFVVVVCCLVPTPRIDANLILFLAEVGPVCAAIYCGRRCRLRHTLVPLILCNAVAWIAFTLIVRLFNSVGWTSVNIIRSDVPPFVGIAVASQFLLLFVAWVVGVRRAARDQ